MKPAPTLRDLAAELGLSLYTVSLGLRGSKLVSAATRLRVREAAERMGYRPNPTVAALMRSIRARAVHSRLTTLALIMPVKSPQWGGRHRYMADVAAGVRARCEALGFGYEQFVVPPDKPNPRALQRVIESRGIDGVIIGPQYDSGARLGLDFSRLAFVAVGHTLTEVAAHRVTTTALLNIRHALEKTLELGWDRPGILLTDRDNDVVENMMLGAYLGFLHRRIARPPAPFIFKEADLTPENVLGWVRAQRVNAVLASRPVVGRWLETAGLRPGRDVAFAALDRPRGESEFAGIVQRLDEVGGAAVEFLGELVHANARGVPGTPRVVEIEGEWRDGPSMPRRSPSR